MRRSLEHDLSPSPEPIAKVSRRTHDSAPRIGRIQRVPEMCVAIDFGTTFTTIAFTHGKRSNPTIYTVEEFPGDRCMGRNGTQVPSEIWYPSDKTTKTRLQVPTADANILYGYEIDRRLERADIDSPHASHTHSGRISKPKLLLDDNAHLRDLRKPLMNSLKQLKKNKLITKEEDVITDLLTCFLAHTKSILSRDYGYTSNTTVEVILTVPVSWSARANAVLNTCLQSAMKMTQFGTDGVSSPLLFMVNEAEAAATYALTSEKAALDRNETFVLLDCGGGTTDVGTYKTDHEHPLRLGEEVTHPKGAVCGSSDLNERMREFVTLQLRDEHYLERPEEGITIENIIESEILPKFESEVKRVFDSAKDETFYFRIRGLREHPVNSRLKQHHFVLSSDDLRSLFDESLKVIEQLMLEQLAQAKSSNTQVDKVVLVGGYADSPTLKRFLEMSLNRFNNQYGTNIILVVPPSNTSATGVATGALMRAQNKENGPKRVPCRSIGVLYHIPDDPEYDFAPEVLSQSWSTCELSGEEYIMRTLKWIIKAGMGELEAVHTFKFVSMHYFSPDAPQWIAEEALYASDTCVEDYYTRSHVKNRGKTTEFGVVQFDVTHLKNRIKMYVPPDAEQGSERYEVTLRICVKVIDRHLEFVAYWPDDDENAATIYGSQTIFDLSSAFKPGTA